MHCGIWLVQNMVPIVGQTDGVSAAIYIKDMVRLYAFYRMNRWSKIIWWYISESHMFAVYILGRLNIIGNVYRIADVVTCH